MGQFTHQRHKPLTPLERPRELILATPSLRSSVNLSRIVRLASCAGVNRVITSGPVKVDPKIARDGVDRVTVESRRSLPPVLKQFGEEGYQLVGLEQSTDSVRLYSYKFSRRTVLVIGHERQGLTDDLLKLLDAVVEIPVYGLPYSYNVATATAMAVYEYCRQYPAG